MAEKEKTVQRKERDQGYMDSGQNESRMKEYIEQIESERRPRLRFLARAWINADHAFLKILSHFSSSLSFRPM